MIILSLKNERMIKMTETSTIREAIHRLITEMAEKGYSPGTIKTYQSVLHGLARHMEERSLSQLDEDVGMAYVRHRTVTEMKGFWGTGDRKTNRIMKPVQALIKFLETGTVSYFMRSKISEYIPPNCFREEYELFQGAYEERQYARATILVNNQTLHKFLDYLYTQGINDSN